MEFCQGLVCSWFIFVPRNFNKSFNDLLNVSMIMGLKFQLLPRTEGFLIYNNLKGIHGSTGQRDGQHVCIEGLYSVPSPALKYQRCAKNA
jgi:hypothetical protein